MNPTALIHLFAALLGIAAALPLLRRRVKINRWYGIRVPAAFVSEARWYEVNEYGGKVFLGWSVVVGATAVVGLFLPRGDWIAYNWAALVVILAGLAWCVFLVSRHCRRY